MIERLQNEVEELQMLSLENLREKWRARYGSPPRLRSLPLMRLTLAWRIQAEALGGVDPEIRRRLRRGAPAEREGLSFGIGAKLRREWKGRIVEVEVVENGFRWSDVTYRSLSAAASAIAGTRWNGPRFFGLREQKP